MYRPAASLLPDISFACTLEELFVSLERMMSGFPLPSNVTTDINPYIYMPSNLPGLVKKTLGVCQMEYGILCAPSKTQIPDMDTGRLKGKPLTFLQTLIIGRKISHEFYEGQVFHEHKTDWVMQEFSITRKRVCESTKSENSGSLCRVFLSAERTPNSENQQSMSTVDTSQDSSSNPQVNDDDEKTELAVSERPANNHVPYLPDSDYISRADFLESLDLLDEPVSPSSSSKTSSCVTMSSDDFFDPDAWLLPLHPTNQLKWLCI